MNHAVFCSLRCGQCLVVVGRTKLHLPLVFQHAGQRQTGLKARWRSLHCTLVTHHSLLWHALLTAQMSGFKPAAVIA